MELRVNNMAPDVNAGIKSRLYKLQRRQLPFHPLIMVFSTGGLSEEDCVPMVRDPMPPVGLPFSDNVMAAFDDAVRLNPSIHDGAIVFSRAATGDEYRLSAWSMRIVSNRKSDEAQPNVGSAHNSALALSLSPDVDLCAIISTTGAALFENGRIVRFGL